MAQNIRGALSTSMFVDRLFLCVAVWVLIISSSAQAVLPQRNPLDAVIPQFSWSVELEDVVTIPNSSGSTKPRLEFLTAGGGPGLAYTVDQRGKIYSFDPTEANPTPTLFLNLSTSVANFHSQNQTGVRGLAFHPDFNNADTDGFRKFYTAHSRNSFAPPVDNPEEFPSPSIGVAHHSVVGEWTVNANGTVNTASYRELMRIGQPFNDHNIGQIGFNPNATLGGSDYGNLYITLGDGGNVFPINETDPHDTGQDLSTPHGSILRIDPIASGSVPYTIPTDNPFRISDAPGISQNAIWAYGLRNPHRFSFDTAGSGALLISDIGQANIEEINLGIAGANYGWDLREGTFVNTSSVTNGINLIDNLSPDHATDAFTYPVAQYDHTNNLLNGSVAIVGAGVYRGTAVPQLTGMYLFGDFATNSGPIFAVDVDDLVERDDYSNLEDLNDGLLAPYEELRLTHNGQEKSLLQILRDELGNQSLSRTDMRFGTGPNNELYVLNKRDGVIRKFVAASGLLDGDTNRDGDVDGPDFLAWQRGIEKASPDWSDGNFNADSTSDAADLALWHSSYGNVVSVATIPEPASATGCLIAMLFLLGGLRTKA